MARYLLKTEFNEYIGERFSSLFAQFIRFDESRTLYVKFPGYKDTAFHSYTIEYNNNEMLSDAIHFVKEKVKAGTHWPNVKLYQEICNEF